jgi:uncharacterized protein (UPF0335 family)
VEQGSSRPRDNSELLALREQVKKLSSEKAALQEKTKKISKDKKGQCLPFIKQSSNLIHLEFIRVFF